MNHASAQIFACICIKYCSRMRIVQERFHLYHRLYYTLYHTFVHVSLFGRALIVSVCLTVDKLRGGNGSENVAIYIDR